MAALICRRRLALLLPQSGGGGTHPLHSTPFPHSYSSTAAVAGGPDSEPCPATISYLVSCGLSPAAAASVATSRNLRIRSTDKADAVLALLRRHGFSDADIARTVRSAPLLLTLDPDRIIRPKLDFFASLGFEPRRLVHAPLLLGRSLDKHLVPCVQFLRGIVGGDDDIRRGFSRVPRALMVDVDNNMRPAVDALRSHGLAENDIAKLLVIQMGVLMLSPARIGEIVQEIESLGLHVNDGDKRFLNCFRVMCCATKETWRRKVALYRSFGLSEAEVSEAVKKQPTILLFSDESIKKKVWFLRDELKLELSDVMGQPVLLAYSLEKSIMPRCAVLSMLMKEGKIERDIKLLQALLGSGKVFVKKFVSRHATTVPDVVKAYEGKIKFEGFRDQNV